MTDEFFEVNTKCFEVNTKCFGGGRVAEWLGYQDSKLERVIIFLLSLILLNLVAGVIGEMNGFINEINYCFYYNVEFSISSLNYSSIQTLPVTGL